MDATPVGMLNGLASQAGDGISRMPSSSSRSPPGACFVTTCSYMSVSQTWSSGATWMP